MKGILLAHGTSFNSSSQIHSENSTDELENIAIYQIICVILQTKCKHLDKSLEKMIYYRPMEPVTQVIQLQTEPEIKEPKTEPSAKTLRTDSLVKNILTDTQIKNQTNNNQRCQLSIALFFLVNLFYLFIFGKKF